MNLDSNFNQQTGRFESNDKQRWRVGGSVTFLLKDKRNQANFSLYYSNLQNTN